MTSDTLDLPNTVFKYDVMNWLGKDYFWEQNSKTFILANYAGFILGFGRASIYSKNSWKYDIQSQGDQRARAKTV